MSKSFLFWFFFLLAVLAAVWFSRGPFRAGSYGVPGLALFLIAMLFLIGWQVFGFPVQ